MSYIFKKHISTGVTWIAVEEAGLYLCCGCPADTIKHLRKEGCVNSYLIDGTLTENGPNAILLSDMLIHNGQVANLAEFPILQMLYMQGLNLPSHPNYKKSRPMLIGYEKQIKMQLEYVSIGNYGLTSIKEIVDAGIQEEKARKIFATKLHYSGGNIVPVEELVDSLIVDDTEVEIKNGVYIKRLGVNWFEISYKDEKVEVNLNIKELERFLAPYELPFKNIDFGFFSITHTGEGNGWDEERPCMASIIHHNNHIYLIDAGPNILNNLSYLGIGLSEIDGIFLSHIHDDHFAGFTELLNVERKLNFYTSKLIRHTAELKLKALMDSEQDLLQVAFNCIDLKFNVWNDVNGLQVMPVYSPHTVETNTFRFRVKDGEKYKTYAHLSDTINFKEFDVIVSKSPDIFTADDISLVKDSYLSKVDLKKVDVGGGAIHGHLSDYEEDQSDLKIIAHTSHKIDSNDESFVNVDFGETHILIEGDKNDFLRSKALHFVSKYFNMLDEGELENLSNQNIKVFGPGSHIVSREESKLIYLILGGLVCYSNDAGINQTLDAGNFIGFSRRYFREDLPNDYYAWSYVYCMEYEEKYFNQFILKYNLIDDVNSRIKMGRNLRSSNLVHDLFSNSIINRLSKYASKINVDNYSFSASNLKDNLFIISDGKVTVTFENNNAIRIGENEHFGGLELMGNYRRKQHYTIDENVEAIAIPINVINEVPKMLWRLIELEEKRYQLSVFIAK